ncbi:MAG: hypothetical protein WC119_00045 [Synergistaceae bacterium]
MKDEIEIVVRLSEIASKRLDKLRIDGIDIIFDLHNDVEEYVNVWLIGLEVNYAN